MSSGTRLIPVWYLTSWQKGETCTGCRTTPRESYFSFPSVLAVSLTAFRSFLLGSSGASQAICSWEPISRFGRPSPVVDIRFVADALFFPWPWLAEAPEGLSRVANGNPGRVEPSSFPKLAPARGHFFFSPDLSEPKLNVSVLFLNWLHERPHTFPEIVSSFPSLGVKPMARPPSTVVFRFYFKAAIPLTLGTANTFSNPFITLSA